MSDEHEEALSWGDERDPTLVSSKVAKPKKPDADADGEHRGTWEPAFLIVYGVLAGVYLLFAVGWAIFGFTTGVPVQGVFFGIMHQVGVALAVASPFLWAVAVWLRLKSSAARVLWLIVGVVVLAPWPFIIGGMG